MNGEEELQWLRAELARRDALIESQAAEIAALKERFDIFIRRFFGKSGEKIDPAQLELLLGGDPEKKASAAVPADPGPAAEIPKHERKVIKRRAPRIPEHLPVKTQTLDPPEVRSHPERYRRIGEEVSEKLHYQPGEFYRVRTVRGKYVLRDQPGALPIIHPMPASLQARCIASPGLIAEVIDSRFTCHLPYYRLSLMYARMGVQLHRRTLCDWTDLAADWLSIIYRQIQYEHWRTPYRQIDETPIAYLQPGHGKARTGYLWTSNIPGGSVFFHWHEGRDTGGLDALFDKRVDPSAPGQPRRILQCDGYSAYPAWVRQGNPADLMGCHTHMRRKFFDAREQSPKLVAWILRQIAHLYRIEERLRRKKASPVLREAVRAAESRMIHHRLRKVIGMLERRRAILPKSKLGKAVGYALREWSKLEVYLHDGRVEICNNLVENSIRITKLGAKNWLFIGRKESGRKCAILYTIVENCRRLGIPPKEYLEDVLTRLPSMMARDAITLTPANWQKARMGKAESKAG